MLAVDLSLPLLLELSLLSNALLLALRTLG
jgi:hypothetical protein